MEDRCGCVNARHGGFALGLCAYTAIRSQAIFGQSAMFIANAAHNGNDVAAFVVAGLWLGLALLGLHWAVAGYRATLTHYDLVNPASVLYSVGVIALCWWLLQSVLSPAPRGDLLIEIGRALAVSWIASNAVNLWLQLRAVFPGQLPLRQPHPAPVSTSIVPPEVRALQAVAARQSAEIERLTAERDRLALELELELEHRPALEMEKVFKYPGMRRAALAVLHPDRGKTDAERNTLKGLFQIASTYFERIGAR